MAILNEKQLSLYRLLKKSTETNAVRIGKMLINHHNCINVRKTIDVKTFK